MIEVKHCPHCHALCIEIGEMVIAGETYPVVECPRCVVKKELFDEEFEVERIYLVRADGTLIEPA